MRLGGEMQHGVGQELAQQPRDCRAVADIGAVKTVAGMVLDR